ncbi:hypothetical protein [Geodermatophilus sp. URMC 63]
MRVPETDLAEIARGHGSTAVPVREPGDLAAVGEWLAGLRATPLLVDAEVPGDLPSWWLEEAFRGH